MSFLPTTDRVGLLLHTLSQRRTAHRPLAVRTRSVRIGIYTTSWVRRRSAERGVGGRPGCSNMYLNLPRTRYSHQVTTKEDLVFSQQLHGAVRMYERRVSRRWPLLFCARFPRTHPLVWTSSPRHVATRATTRRQSSDNLMSSVGACKKRRKKNEKIEREVGRFRGLRNSIGKSRPWVHGSSRGTHKN